MTLSLNLRNIKRRDYVSNRYSWKIVSKEWRLQTLSLKYQLVLNEKVFPKMPNKILSPSFFIWALFKKLYDIDVKIFIFPKETLQSKYDFYRSFFFFDEIFSFHFRFTPVLLSGRNIRVHMAQVAHPLK